LWFGGGVVAQGVPVRSRDPVHVAVNELCDHAGQDLGAACLKVPAAAPVVVLAGREK